MSKFADTLLGLGFRSYGEYLSSEHWQAFRTSYRNSGLSRRCAVCGLGRVQLHHHTYVRLGKEELSDVTPLCRPHHESVHEWLKTSGRVFVEYTHEAIAALKCTAPSRPAPATKAVEGRVRKKGESQKQAARRDAKKKKQERRAAQAARRREEAAKLPPKPLPVPQGNWKDYLRRIAAGESGPSDSPPEPIEVLTPKPNGKWRSAVFRRSKKQA